MFGSYALHHVALCVSSDTDAAVLVCSEQPLASDLETGDRVHLPPNAMQLHLRPGATEISELGEPQPQDTMDANKSLSISSGGTTLYFRAASGAEMQAWRDALLSAVCLQVQDTSSNSVLPAADHHDEDGHDENRQPTLRRRWGEPPAASLADAAMSPEDEDRLTRQPLDLQADSAPASPSVPELLQQEEEWAVLRSMTQFPGSNARLDVPSPDDYTVACILSPNKKAFQLQLIRLRQETAPSQDGLPSSEDQPQQGGTAAETAVAYTSQLYTLRSFRASLQALTDLQMSLCSVVESLPVIPVWLSYLPQGSRVSSEQLGLCTAAVKAAAEQLGWPAVIDHFFDLAKAEPSTGSGSATTAATHRATDEHLYTTLIEERTQVTQSRLEAARAQLQQHFSGQRFAAPPRSTEELLAVMNQEDELLRRLHKALTAHTKQRDSEVQAQLELIRRSLLRFFDASTVKQLCAGKLEVDEACQQFLPDDVPREELQALLAEAKADLAERREARQALIALQHNDAYTWHQAMQQTLDLAQRQITMVERSSAGGVSRQVHNLLQQRLEDCRRQALEAEKSWKRLHHRMLKRERKTLLAQLEEQNTAFALASKNYTISHDSVRQLFHELQLTAERLRQTLDTLLALDEEECQLHGNDRQLAQLRTNYQAAKLQQSYAAHCRQDALSKHAEHTKTTNKHLQRMHQQELALQASASARKEAEQRARAVRERQSATSATEAEPETVDEAVLEESRRRAQQRSKVGP